MNSETEHERWLSVRQAAHEIGVSASKISRLIGRGEIQAKKDPYDNRLTLVNMSQLRHIFPPRER